MLIIANHVRHTMSRCCFNALRLRYATVFAAAMSGECSRTSPCPQHGVSLACPLGPLVWLLLKALFNAFSATSAAGLSAYFAHAGDALDHGFHVVVFPEGTRSAEGTLARFRPGIGFVSALTSAPVLPMALLVWAI